MEVTYNAEEASRTGSRGAGRTYSAQACQEEEATAGRRRRRCRTLRTRSERPTCGRHRGAVSRGRHLYVQLQRREAGADPTGGHGQDAKCHNHRSCGSNDFPRPRARRLARDDLHCTPRGSSTLWLPPCDGTCHVPWCMRCLQSMGFKLPTPVQVGCIPAILAGYDPLRRHGVHCVAILRRGTFCCCSVPRSMLGMLRCNVPCTERITVATVQRVATELAALRGSTDGLQQRCAATELRCTATW